MATTTIPAQPCPDPSAHQGTHKLSEQASTAALLASQPDRNHDSHEHVLGADGKLSSKSAAASLKYAKPQDLPSFPSHGIDTANSAGHAAMLAKDYKMKELWQPGLSAAGSRAALLAAKDGGKLDLWQPSASADGNSAAKLAMKNKTLSPQIDYGYTKDGRSNALLAATKSQRQRSGSTPVPRAAAYPDSANSQYNALNAATISHRAASKGHSPRDPDGWDSAAMQAARIQNIGDRIDPEMFTEKPPILMEKQEKADQAALRASAISMAKQMYDVQHRATLGDPSSSPALDGKQFAAHVAAPPPTDIKQEAMKYIHLQDAAHKLAQERLAKVDKSFEARRYREYYGYDNSPKSRLSTRSFTRKRASSETAKDDWDSDDEENAQRVRQQMSQFNTALATVDSKKQQADRDQLLAIAQKRVQKSMADMDEKVFQDTGKVSQAMMDDWEAKARKRAAEDAEKREATRGKTHIGAGKYMDTAEIEAIAQARLRPTFDEINEVAEKKRARDAEIRLDKQEQERQKQLDKQRDREHKDILKKAKQEQKTAAKEERAAAKETETKDDHSNRRSILGMLSLRHKDRDAKKDASSTKPTGAADATETAADDTLATPAIVTTTNTTPSQAPPTDAVTDERISSEDRSATTSPAAASTTVQPSDAKSETASLSNDNKQSKGVKGLFAKLKPKRSKHDGVDEEPKTSSFEHDKGALVTSDARADKQNKDDEPVTTPVVAAGVTEPPDLPEHTGTDGQIGSASKVSGTDGNPEALSPSSFKRRDDADDADVSSLSSSGLEEEDLAEGRTGRMARALGLGKLKKNKNKDGKKSTEEEREATADAAKKSSEEPSAVVASTKADKDDDDDDEAFEEARDTIDPASAPEPAFAGQKATAQHGRETKFQEEL